MILEFKCNIYSYQLIFQYLIFSLFIKFRNTIRRNDYKKAKLYYMQILTISETHKLSYFFSEKTKDILQQTYTEVLVKENGTIHLGKTV